MKRILTVIGARPQIIKSAALSRSFKNQPYDRLDEVVLNTAQHYDTSMSGRFFQELSLDQPKYTLSSRLSLTTMIPEILKVIDIEKPNGIVVYGDTNSTLAGAIAASIRDLKLFHIEAGLRSGNFDMPEEWNRLFTDHLSTVLFSPTTAGVEHLKKECLSGNKVVKTGDIMLDNALYYKHTPVDFSVLKENKLTANSYLLFTCHRPSNADDSLILRSILLGILGIAKKLNKKVVFPIHPRTKKQFNQLNTVFKDELEKWIIITAPCGYLQTIELISNCLFVISDSGGIQKEAYFFNKKSLVLREETEWTEIIDDNAAILVGNDTARILKGADDLACLSPSFSPIFGDGQSAKHICEVILESL